MVEVSLIFRPDDLYHFHPKVGSRVSVCVQSAYVPVVCLSLFSRIPSSKFSGRTHTTCKSISCAYFISIKVCCCRCCLCAAFSIYAKFPLRNCGQCKQTQAFLGFSYTTSVRRTFRQHFSSYISSNLPRRSLSWTMSTYCRPFGLLIVSPKVQLMEFICVCAHNFLHTNIVSICHIRKVLACEPLCHTFQLLYPLCGLVYFCH